MRPAIGGLVVATVLGLAACSPGGTPSPSSVTVTPTVHWATPRTSTTAAPSARPSNHTPQPARQALLVTTELVGPVALGSASPADARARLDDLLGAPATKMACGGTATSLRWGSLSVTFAGTPAVARSWEIDIERGTANLRLPRGIEWSPDLDAMLERQDTRVTTSGAETTVTLLEGWRYRFGDDRRARTVGAGTLGCG